MNKLLILISAAAVLTVFASPAYADQQGKTVFLTIASFNGNLGGLTGADKKCQEEADGPASIVPSSTYLAWLSDGADSPVTRFNRSALPYILPDGTKIAEDFADLTDGSILHPIDIDTAGNRVERDRFWSGTRVDGTGRGELFSHCDGWTRGLITNRGGMAVKTEDGLGLRRMRDCGWPARLACFQQ